MPINLGWNICPKAKNIVSYLVIILVLFGSILGYIPVLSMCVGTELPLPFTVIKKCSETIRDVFDLQGHGFR